MTDLNIYNGIYIRKLINTCEELYTHKLDDLVNVHVIERPKNYLNEFSKKKDKF